MSYKHARGRCKPPKMTSNNTSKWPGEWHPARNDVALASEAPDPALLSDFKTRLLASEDARGMQDMMHIDLSKKVRLSAARGTVHLPRF